MAAEAMRSSSATMPTRRPSSLITGRRRTPWSRMTFSAQLVFLLGNRDRVRRHHVRHLDAGGIQLAGHDLDHDVAIGHDAQRLASLVDDDDAAHRGLHASASRPRTASRPACSSRLVACTDLRFSWALLDQAGRPDDGRARMPRIDRHQARDSNGVSAARGRRASREDRRGRARPRSPAPRKTGASRRSTRGPARTSFRGRPRERRG